MSENISEFIKKLKGIHLTDSSEAAKISKTREILTLESRDIDRDKLLNCYIVTLLKAKPLLNG